MNKDNPTLTTLSDRLIHALELLGVTQAELARKLQVKPQAINFLCKNQTKKSALSYQIAEVLNISSEWLAHGVGPVKYEDDPQYKLVSLQKRIPIVTYEQLIKFCKKHLHTLESDNELDWILTTSNIGEQGYAFKLIDKSMYPRFEQGTIVIMNTERLPNHQDFVLAYIDSTEDIVFRQLEIDNNKEKILHPINIAMYKPINITNEDKIIGTLVEARWQI